MDERRILMWDNCRVTKKEIQRISPHTCKRRRRRRRNHITHRREERKSRRRDEKKRGSTL
jgi:hypothetical protein